ncbi:hypothetical protein IU431_14270 [Nocardia otitidiscaviarum]|uniref:hypothetical protein n=1 Tax=Nocardia otitidiscaviarum TaxID=1823 RepID=UPI0006935B56|nr:hypothetical protein [Nocardia otitidiscaviarum]MBF6485303.1 hypothetical protein [Nocardia otitidiscaviarum]
MIIDQVRTYYSTYLPQTTAALDDPETHFQQLAEQISERVQQVSIQLEAEAITPGQDYLERVGTLNTVRSQALEMALAELLYSTAPEVEDDPEPSQTERDLLEMQQEERAVEQRLEMEPGSPEATEWDRRYPHLVEEVAWTLADHDELTTEQKREQLAQILQRQDEARARLQQ